MEKNNIDIPGSTGFLITDSHAADLTITAPEYNNITFNCGDNREVVLTYDNGKLEMSGDGDMNEAAKTFFNFYLKNIVDAYVKKCLDNPV